MSLTTKGSSRLNFKQKTGGDLPVVPVRPFTGRYEATSTSGQTTISLTFAVDQASTNNFLLIINGQVLRLGASHDFTFTNIQADNTSSTITLNQSLAANLNIIALWMGIQQPNISASTIQASVNTNTAAIPKNYLVNGAFDHWQRTTSITGIANGTSVYGPDRWYAKNSLGTNGVLRFDQTTGVVQGSLFGASLKISTAPTAAQANGCEMYQVIENLRSIELYNQVASFTAQIKALGNVNQVGVQFFYATSEVKLTTAIGSEVLVAVNSSTFSLATIAGQALGTAMTTSGVVGVRIRITGVSSGNTYDLNNGFIVEQAMVSQTSTVPTFKRMYEGVEAELNECLRYYWRINGTQFFAFGYFATTTVIGGQIRYPVRMRAPATPSFSANNEVLISRPGSSNTSATQVAFTQSSADGVKLADNNDTGSPTTAASASTSGFATMIGTTNFFQADAEI